MRSTAKVIGFPGQSSALRVAATALTAKRVGAATFGKNFSSRGLGQMMETSEITVQILRDIRDDRDEVRQTNIRVDQTREESSAQIDATNRGLAKSEIRTSTAIAAVAGTLTDLKTIVVDRLDLRDRVQRCEEEIAALKSRGQLAVDQRLA